MPSSFQLIWRVSFRHAFFSDGILRALRIVPVAACHDMLRRAGVLLRAEEDGIALYGDERATERLRLHLGDAGARLDMAFQVFFTDPHFFEYTLPAWQAGQVMFLDTAAAANDGAGRRTLHAAPCVAADALLEREHPTLEAILGKRRPALEPAMVLQVAVTPALLDSTEPGQRHFQVCFDAASSYWKYWLFNAGEAQAVIVDLAGEVEFDRCAGVEIGERRQADVFLSKQAIPMREVATARFQLRAASPAGDKVLIKRMPNASLGKRFRDEKDGNRILVSEIFINQ